MPCTFCGSALPGGALFCGECGRAVAAAESVATAVVAPIAQPPAPPALVSPPPVAQPEPHERPWSESTDARCQQCGTAMGPQEIFCSECGAVSPLAARSFSQPRDTVVIERIAAATTPPVARSATPVPSSERPAVSRPLPPAPLTLPDLPAFLSGVGEPDVEEPVVEKPVAPVRPAVSVSPARDRVAPSADEEIADLEATRIVKPKRAGGERFILQFSTGESSTVQGTGLIGRNPIPEPGEYFDQLVRVIDPSRSVSKTHLEFGQDAGSFWILDRFSGNGTIVREPDTAAVRCQPDKRYRLVRGTRVEIGEQFFIVS
ncbi:double zinc ribbon domain-containing protein [Lacisediminihabitans changchengi]|uniref:FHA domain-containing protein n=1 Tax=Lacisediminihabitans changchengi TaxID=2787634 RepID=A0A934SL15_9MICO|nr:zinc ribbon domain-containing protein [Lacisediminihabitans changchengi]MBK4347518.1 FHA domain-containing protein [Lacisediminihabitans changchengi]